ncbi:MAG: MBL fold metallo-hydrolase [Cyclobacteriaceae bacterium]
MKICSLEIIAAPFGSPVVLHPTLIESGSEVILVDCGYSGSLDSIEAQLKWHSLTVKDLTTVIITHDDIDHVGGLFELQRVNPKLKVATSAIEAPFVEGKLKSMRLAQAEQAMDKIPREMIDWALAFQRELRAIKRVPVDRCLHEGQFDDSVQVVNTPGHTPGHISLYIPSSRTMIAGDAVVLEDGELNIANPQFTMDLGQAIESARKLADFVIDELHCYHGGVLTIDVNKKIIELIDRYQEHKLISEKVY